MRSYSLNDATAHDQYRAAEYLPRSLSSPAAPGDFEQRDRDDLARLEMLRTQYPALLLT